MRVSSVMFLALGLTMTGSGAALAQAGLFGAGPVEYYEAVTRNGRATRAPRQDCRRVQNAGRSLWECPTSRSSSPGATSAGAGYTRPEGGSGGGY